MFVVYLAAIAVLLGGSICALNEPSVFNFASSVAGAKILASSAGIATAQGCLDPDPDRYLLIERGNKFMQWIVIQLSEDITPKRIEVQNSEYYATSPSLIEVSASLVWPTERWALVAELPMRKSRSNQSFNLNTEHVFRYLKIRIKDVHDVTRLCTLNSFRVFGVPALQPALSRLDDVDSGIEQLMSFSLKYSDLPQPVYLSKNTEVSCPIPTFRSSSIFLNHPISLDDFAPRLVQPDSTSNWENEEYRTSGSGSVYSNLMSRLRSIALRQKLLHSATKHIFEQSERSSSRLQSQMVQFNRKVVEVDMKQRRRLQEHSDLLQSSQLQIHIDLLTRAVPRLMERAVQFEEDLDAVIYLAIGTAISSAVLLLAVFYKF